MKYAAVIEYITDKEKIQSLPLNGRQVTDLITLSNGAVQIAQANHGTFQEGVLISIAGGQNFGVMYSLDGAAHNDPYQGAQMPLPFLDDAAARQQQNDLRDAAVLVCVGRAQIATHRIAHVQQVLLPGGLVQVVPGVQIGNRAIPSSYIGPGTSRKRPAN